MPYPKVIQIPKPCFLLLAGLWLVAPMALGTGPAGAHTQTENVFSQNENASTAAIIAGGTDDASSTYRQLARVSKVTNELRGAPTISDGSHGFVAPRLQSRIKINPEFAAFVKLVRSTSDKKYSPAQLRKLYISFKEWSLKNDAQSQ